MRDRNLIQIGAMEIRLLIDEDQSAGSLVMFEFTVPPQARVPAAHYHRDVDEVIYGLSGTMTTTLDGRKHEIAPGKPCSFRAAMSTPTRTCTEKPPRL